MCDEPYMIIGLGNAYDFVIKNVNEPETYGTFQGDKKSIKEFIEKVNRIVKENEQLKSEIEKLSYANEDLLEEKRIWKQMSDEYTKLSDDNEQLKSRVEYLERKIDRERTSYQKQHEKWEEEIQKENEQLKQFIQSLAKQSVNGKVMLRDGKVYDLNKILKKGDVK